MLTTDHIADAVVDLRAALVGEVVLAGEPAYDTARAAWNLVADQRPALVAAPATVDDVAAIVCFARAHGLRVAPQGTGHNATSLGPLDEAVLLRTHELDAVSVDPVARVARAEAGAIWEQVVDAAAPHGLIALHGSSPDVGVVGFTLGGGHGWAGRLHGLATNSVVAVELVTADGVPVRVTAESDAELFWALRGGNAANFGVVTAIEMRLYEHAEAYAGQLFFDVARAREVLRAWRDWSRQVPDHVSSIAQIVNVPPLPDVPEPLRGRSFAMVIVSVLGDDGEAIVAPLRALGPEMDTVAAMPAAGLVRIAMDPEDPMPAMTTTAILEEVSDAAIDAIVEVMRPEAGLPVFGAMLRQLGGAYARRAPGAGVKATMDGEALFLAGSAVMGPEMAPAVLHALAVVEQAVAPFDSGERYLNFVEQPGDTRVGFSAEDHARLRAVRERVDPDGVLLANHPIA